jgi:hypothetical protein
MTSIPILVEAKKEYTNQLQQILSPRIYEGFKSIYEELINVLSQELYEKKSQNTSLIRMFQKSLKDIPLWNSEMIKNEHIRIEKISNCDYLENLIEAIFITNTKILTSVQINNKNSINLKINVPQSQHFIHKCYIECSKEIYKNPYIFDVSKNITPKERHNNLREILNIINNAISNAIRNLLPIRDILKQGLTNNNLYEDNDEENITQNITVSKDIDEVDEESINQEKLSEDTYNENSIQNEENNKNPESVELKEIVLSNNQISKKIYETKNNEEEQNDDDEEQNDDEEEKNEDEEEQNDSEEEQNDSEEEQNDSEEEQDIKEKQDIDIEEQNEEEKIKDEEDINIKKLIEPEIEEKKIVFLSKPSNTNKIINENIIKKDDEIEKQIQNIMVNETKQIELEENPILKKIENIEKSNLSSTKSINEIIKPINNTFVKKINNKKFIKQLPLSNKSSQSFYQKKYDENLANFNFTSENNADNDEDIEKLQKKERNFINLNENISNNEDSDIDFE